MSTWQDWTLTFVSVVFAVALIPSVRSTTHKPPISTSVLTGTMLAVTAFVEATLALWFSTISTAVGATIWLILGWQVYRRGDERH